MAPAVTDGNRAVRRRPVARLRDVAAKVRPPTLVLAAVVVVWCCVFGVLVYQAHDRFRSFAFDLGIYDQAVWLVARGHEFMTVRGLNVFGHHANLAFYLLAPFSWLGAGPHFLNLLQVGVLGLGAVAVHQAARFHLRHDWLPVVLAAAFLLHPSTQWFVHELFHPEVIAITVLLFAYVAALHRRWRWFAGLVVFAMAWKEDVALAVAALGFVLLLRRERRAGALALAGGLAWFLVATQLLVHRESGGVFYAQQFYGDFGSTTAEVARTALTEPARVVERLRTANAGGYVRALLEPYGFLPVLSPLPLVLGLPQAFANLLSVHNFTWDPHLHYAALPVVATTIATVEGVAAVASLGFRRFLTGLVIVAAWATTVTSGAAPVSRRYESGIWPLRDNERQAAMEAATGAPPDDAVVSASYTLVPHLTHRRGIYLYPNPWVLTNWGVDNRRGPDPRVVEWIVLDRRSISTEETRILDGLVAAGEFRVVVSSQDVVAAVRR